MSDNVSFGSSVSDKWAILRAGEAGAGSLEVPSLALDVVTSVGPIRLALGPCGEARLLLPVEPPVGLDGIRAGSALRVAVSSYTHRGFLIDFLDITCLSSDLESVFRDVSEQIIGRIAGGEGVVAAVRTTLEDFRTLLYAQPASDIDRRRVSGLIAELILLNRLLEGSPSAWKAWHGPAGDRHDFRVSSKSLEVKASTSSVVTINGLDQLEPPSGGSLHLLHFVLEPVPKGLLTVADLGGQALRKADDPEALRALFAAAGCPDVDSDEWNRHAFRVESETLYLVAGDFPRIVPSLFRDHRSVAGIVEVTYRLDLVFAASWQCSAREFEELMRIFSR